MSADQHPFKEWLLEEHAGKNTPLGDVAFDVSSDSSFPTEGDRQDLLRYFEDKWSASAAFLDCFEAAWQMFRPTCLTPGCNRVVGIQMSLCSVHIDMTELL
jgi:hypothetical protein